MPNSRDFIAHVLEMMRPVASASARAMFGGHGIYAEGLFIAIVVDDTVYLKADDDNRGEFTALGLEHFRYAMKSGELQSMSYFRPPDEALESPAGMTPWLRSAIGAALRAASAKAPRKRKPEATEKPAAAKSRRQRRP